VLFQKFWFAFFITSVITGVVMMVSCHILHFSAWKTAGFLGAIVLMSATLSGMAAGLGALFPNFREDNPSKIVSGFGGTLCLVGSFIYVTVFSALVAMPEVWSAAGGAWPIVDALWWCAAVLFSGLVLGVPLFLAGARVKRLEV
jgi:ABC-2 type transport system permease protein